MVPLRHVLVDGDTVEIMTNDKQFPRKDWLEFAVSGKARNQIRHIIRGAERERSIQLGRDILSRELRQAGFSLKQLLSEGDLSELAQSEIKGGEVDDLFAAVSYGKFSASRIVKLLKGEEADSALRPEPLQDRLRSLFKKRSGRDGDKESGIRVSGQPDVMVRFGGCCDPLPGDEVLGFVTRGRGVTVHARSCRRVFEVDPERRIDVDWDPELSVARKVRIRVTSTDRHGILSKVTNSISAAGINISGLKVDVENQEKAVQNYELWVGNSQILNAVIKEISRIKGVISVDRVRG